MRMYKIPEQNEIDLELVNTAALMFWARGRDMMAAPLLRSTEFLLVAAGWSKKELSPQDIEMLGRDLPRLKKMAVKLFSYSGCELPVDMLAFAMGRTGTLESIIWLASIKKPSRFLEVLRLMTNERPQFKSMLGNVANDCHFDIETRRAIGQAGA